MPLYPVAPFTHSSGHNASKPRARNCYFSRPQCPMSAVPSRPPVVAQTPHIPPAPLHYHCESATSSLPSATALASRLQLDDHIATQSRLSERAEAMRRNQGVHTSQSHVPSFPSDYRGHRYNRRARIPGLFGSTTAPPTATVLANPHTAPPRATRRKEPHQHGTKSHRRNI